MSKRYARCKSGPDWLSLGMGLTDTIKRHVDSLIATNRTIQRYNKERYNTIGKKYVSELTSINEMRIEAGIKFMYHV